MQRAATAPVWQIMDDSGIKWEAIAKYLGCHPKYLDDMRYGQVPMSRPMMEKISEFFGVSVESLFGEYLRESAVLKKGRE